MTVAQHTFRYDPLPREPSAIRILNVEPELLNGLIQCSITHHDTPGPYLALSYMWGPKTDDQTILLNGKSFVVRRNLWEFLRLARLHPEVKEQSLWIDGICIDQSNTQEKNHQVSLMARIYKSAVGTISWLGGSLDPDGPSHLSKIPGAEIPTSIQLFDDEVNQCFVHVENARRYLAHHDKFCPPKYRTVAAALTVVEKVCQHPYWGRAWILQELFLNPSRMVLIDNLAITWEPLLRLLNVLFGESSLVEQSRASRTTMTTNVRKGPPGLEFAESRGSKKRRKRRMPGTPGIEDSVWHRLVIANSRQQACSKFGFADFLINGSAVKVGAVTKLLSPIATIGMSSQCELERIHDRFKDTQLKGLITSITPLHQSSAVSLGIVTSYTTKGWEYDTRSISKIDIFSRSQCFDRRDKIYSICSLLNAFQGFAVDYDEDVYALYIRASLALFPQFGGGGTRENAALQLLVNLGLGPIDLVWGGKAQVLSTINNEATDSDDQTGHNDQEEKNRVEKKNELAMALAGVCLACKKKFSMKAQSSVYRIDTQKFSGNTSRKEYCSLMLCQAGSTTSQSNAKSPNRQLDHIAIYESRDGLVADAWSSSVRPFTHTTSKNTPIQSRYSPKVIAQLVHLHIGFRDKLEGGHWKAAGRRNLDDYRRKRKLNDASEAYLRPSTHPAPPIPPDLLDTLQLEEVARRNFYQVLQETGMLIIE